MFIQLKLPKHDTFGLKVKFSLKLLQLPLKAVIRSDEVSLVLNKLVSIFEYHFHFLHQVGDNDRGASGNSCKTVNQNYPTIFNGFFDEFYASLKMLLQVCRGYVQNTNQLVAKHCWELRLNALSHSQNMGDAILFEHEFIIGSTHISEPKSIDYQMHRAAHFYFISYYIKLI